jgi:predicted ATPase
VVSDDKGSNSNIAADIGNLVAKSLVSVETCGESVQYRLLDSMQAYARQKLEQSGELAALYDFSFVVREPGTSSGKTL